MVFYTCIQGGGKLQVGVMARIPYVSLLGYKAGKDAPDASQADMR